MAKFRSISLAIIIAISALLIVANYFTIRLTSAVRAYISGESRYSKGQNDATIELILFLDAKDSVHWKSFLTKIKIPIGDSIARVALENDGSLDVIKGGFIQGENHPEDLDDMIWLFRNFRRTNFISKAIQIWKEGDFLIGQLYSEGQLAHQKIRNNSFSEGEKKAAIARIDFLLPLLIKKEQEFSDVLGTVARKSNRYLLATNIILILIIIGTAGRYVIGAIETHIHDAAEREKNEADRRQSEIYLRGILDSTTDGILAADSSGKIINSNNRFTELWKIPNDLLEGKNDAALLAHVVDQVKDANSFLSSTQALYHSHKTSLDELEFKDGKIFERASTPLILNSTIVGRVWSFRDITERKEAELALKQSEEKFRLLYNKTPVMMHSIEADGTLSRVSNFWLEKMAYSRDEVIGRLATDFLTEESKEKTINKFLPEFFETGVLFNVECDFVTKTGKIFNTILSANAEYDERGNIVRSLSVVTDISEAKKMMVTLELAHKIAKLGIWQIDFIHDTWECDDNLKEIFGFKGRSLSREEYWNCIHPDEKEAKMVRDRMFLQSIRTDYQDEYRIVRPGNHEIRYIKSQGFLVRDKQGAPSVGISVVFDQTTEKLAEKNLQLKSFTIEHSSDPIFWIRPDGSFADINPAAYESLGYSLEEMLCLKVPDIDFQYNEKVWPLHWEELREKRTLKFPSVQRKKDGSLLDVEIIANYIKFEGQEFNCAIIRDVTERKKSEAALLQQFEELQKINHELDRFVYSVSHDLRAPLASLLGLISIAELEKPSPSFQSYFIMMRQSINRLDGFIKDILDYSRNSRTEILLEKIDFKDLIAEVQNNLRQMSGFERLKIEVKILEDVAFYSDRSRIEILLNNLFSNAIKYLDPQKNSPYVQIDISTSSSGAIISFSDNGIGIDEAHLSKIFDMFYRATEKAKGSGLGLYIARETAAKLKGAITVQSEIYNGTTFEICIPNADDC